MREFPIQCPATLERMSLRGRGVLFFRGVAVGLAIGFGFGMIVGRRRADVVAPDLTSPHPSVRADAIWQLVVQPDEKRANQLAGGLTDPDDEVRLASAIALIRLGRKAIRPLRSVLKRVSEEEARNPKRPFHYLPGDFFRHPTESAQFILAGIARQTENLRAVANLIADPDPLVASIAQRALKKVGPSVLPVMSQLLKSDRKDVRFRALGVVSSFGDASVDALASVVGEPNRKTESQLDQETRQVAVSSLGDTGSDRALEILKRSLKDPMLEPYAWDAIARLGTLQAVAFLKERVTALAHGGKPSPPFLRALGTSGEGEFVSVVLPYLTHPDPNLQAAAAYAAGKLRAHGAVDQLLSLLASPSPFVVIEAAQALSQLGESRALPALLRLLRHPSNSVKVSALIALQSLGDRSVLPALEALSRDRKVPDYIRSQAQSVADYLKRRGS